MKDYLSLLIILFFIANLSGQGIPDERVVGINELENLLKPEVQAMLSKDDGISAPSLAQYFRQKFAERFFYDYQTFPDRFEHYIKLYDNLAEHRGRANDHLNKYPDSTHWLLPFNYKFGEPVNAYALRHLARQHKMVDIAIHHFNNKEDGTLIPYFENQMKSLNEALASGTYEKIEDGNGVYEVYRSGYRILNWLRIHNMFLDEPDYSDEDQLYTIATLLQHGAHLYNRNNEFRSGNHQTRGMSALAMLSIVLRDFEGTELWYERAMLRLSEHLEKEINDDGFQFERSVHYHMSDIKNYFFVYQLAKISKIDVDKDWEDKLHILFSTLAKIAYPDGSAPVLQDDTEIPWGEKNDISEVMTLGYLLFEDPEFGYFASSKVDSDIYWFLQERQLKLLDNIQKKKPTYGSLAFTDTHYYVMREGWSRGDKMMIVSAGLDDKKPDHQHGDMLGIQAMANGKVILPNYQVRYSLKDFELFKNSMVKNVALVDDELQGKKWTSNKGGSGFGKFKQLPTPEVISWQSNENFDLFVGSHDGFEAVDYTRQVIYIKDEMWIVKDDFHSDKMHEYKQVWQGHYTEEGGPNLIRATFDDATGCDIVQLNPIEFSNTSGARGKNWTVLSLKDRQDFTFLTIVYPYVGYSNRIDESGYDKIGNWEINNGKWKIEGNQPTALTDSDQGYFFNVDGVENSNIRLSMSAITDLFIHVKKNQLHIQMLGKKEIVLSLRHGDGKEQRVTLSPGHEVFLNLD